LTSISLTTLTSFLGQEELETSISTGKWKTQPHNEAILGMRVLPLSHLPSLIICCTLLQTKRSELPPRSSSFSVPINKVDFTVGP
jgi:hypothetical protein